MRFAAAIVLCALKGAAALNPFATALRALHLTPQQQLYVSALKDPAVQLVVCTGPAGTGKTALAVLQGLSELRRQNTARFVLTRPSVLIDADNFGALPGGMQDKVAPLFRHIQDIAAGAQECAAATHNILKDRAVQVVPLEYLRGLTLQETWILADEAQNTTPRQMKALLTRVGQNAKLIVCGDLQQSDLPGPNGLQDLLDRLPLHRAPDQVFQTVQLSEEDVKRSELVKWILQLYR